MQSDRAQRDTTILAMKSNQELCNAIPSLKRYAMSLTRNSDRADDLVQDTLLRSVAKMHLWKPGTNMAAWTCTIMLNIFRGHLQRKMPQHFGEGLVEEVEQEMPANQMQSAELSRVGQALDLLHRNHRDILLKVAVEGATYAEAADELGMPVGTVRSRLARARQALRYACGEPRSERSAATSQSG